MELRQPQDINTIPKYFNQIFQKQELQQIHYLIYAKSKKIPISDPDFTLDENARYISANIDDNYELIKQSINKVTSDNINDISPPVIAIKRPSHTAPYVYYIRKDLLNIDEPESKVYYMAKKEIH